MKNIALSVTPRQGNLCTTNGALATFAILLSGSGGGAVLERPGDCDYVLDGCDYENQGGDRPERTAYQHNPIGCKASCGEHWIPPNETAESEVEGHCEQSLVNYKSSNPEHSEEHPEIVRSLAP